MHETPSLQSWQDMACIIDSFTTPAGDSSTAVRSKRGVVTSSERAVRLPNIESPGAVSAIQAPATIGSTPYTERTSEQVVINNDVADRETAINIAIVGKYVTHEDAYLSIAKVRNRKNIIFHIVAVVVDPK